MMRDFRASLDPWSADRRLAYFTILRDSLIADEAMRETKGKAPRSYRSAGAALRRLVDAQCDFAQAQLNEAASAPADRSATDGEGR